ncbi:MAG: GNAT family N-acetyltransferase [Candidatus Doudnabacteria bacterium]|nr:GNAT family N-acetyltransferase [Candidatus Doudnabacteria bacterium]
MLKDTFKFQTDRLVIRFYQKNDYPKWKRLLSEMKSKQNQWDWEAEDIADLTPERYQMKLRKHKAERQEGQVFYFCVEDRSSQELAGIALITKLEMDNNSVGIGFQLNNLYWGQGLGTELCKALIAIASSALKASKSLAEVNPQNKVSMQILKKVGFKRMHHSESGRERFLLETN